MNQTSTMRLGIQIVLAFGACGVGILFLPWLWPEARVLGWLLPTVPTLLVLLIGFDRDRSHYTGMAVYKELFGRVILLGTVIVVCWITVLEYIAGDAFILIAVVVACLVSLGMMGAGCIVYVIVRRTRAPLPSSFVVCPQCGYRIDNIAGPNCPECGRRFESEPDHWRPVSMRHDPDDTV